MRLGRPQTLEEFARGPRPSDPVRACAVCWGAGNGAWEMPTSGGACHACGSKLTVVVRRDGRHATWW